MIQCIHRRLRAESGEKESHNRSLGAAYPEMPLLTPLQTFGAVDSRHSEWLERTSRTGINRASGKRTPWRGQAAQSSGRQVCPRYTILLGVVL